MSLRGIHIFSFDTKSFPFREIFTKYLKKYSKCEKLEELHLYLEMPKYILDVCEDQETKAHELLYGIERAYQTRSSTSSNEENLGDFLGTYYNFARYIQSSLFTKELIIQRLPTLRVQFPDNLSVGEYHRDSDYNHPKEEINVWVPLTKSINTAALHIEKNAFSEEYSPINVGYGQFIVFDSLLKHGNEINKEKYTRISFDFRVIPKDIYKANLNSGCSIRQNMKFEIGDYYTELAN